MSSRKKSENCMSRHIEDVTFGLESSAARDIYVVGDFNDWQINDGGRLARRETGAGRNGGGTSRADTDTNLLLMVSGWWIEESLRRVNVFGSFDS